MSKIALTPNASGTGTLTIAAPNTSTDRTLTLPDETGTVMSSVSSVATSQLPAGSVLQVVTATDAGVRSTTSTTFVTASNTLSVSITPRSSSSKVFVTVSSSVDISATNTYFVFTIFRGATNLGSNQGLNLVRVSATSNTYPIAMSYLDSPNTTSATTYQVYLKTDGGTAYLNTGACVGTITAMEIAG